MSRKLYYEDPYLAEFEAMVLVCEPGKNGWEAELTETAFYPGGGGQPCDRGRLGELPVLSMQETKDGRILHTLPQELKPGTWVKGCVDLAYRYDFMQQHTGEHVLSGVIAGQYGFANAGFHIRQDELGLNSVTVDFSGKIPREDVTRIEDAVNGILWKNGAVRCWYPDPETLKSLPYRSKKELAGAVRIVQAGSADACACCGLHVAALGEVGFMKIMSCIPFRGGTRMEVVWGDRALAYVQRLWQDSLEVSQALSAKMLSTGQAARELSEKLDGMKRKLAELEKKNCLLRVEPMAGQKDPIFISHRQICENDKQRQALARVLQEISSGYCAVVEKTGEETWSICMMSRKPDLKPLLAVLQEKFGMKGSSWGQVLQGCITAPLEEITAELHTWLEER